MRLNMKLEETLNIITKHVPDLKSRFGVRSFAIFGSVARGEERPDSDIDILVEFEKPVGLFEFAALRRHLSELLGSKVDLVTPSAIRAEMRENIMSESVRAA
jgi:predicted nucleotidyltransferase